MKVQKRAKIARKLKVAQSCSKVKKLLEIGKVAEQLVDSPTDISISVLSNGHVLRFFSISHGVRQVCPHSGLFFVIALERIARAIKRSPLIKVIAIGNKEVKTTLYAYDTTVFASDSNSIFTIFWIYFRLAGQYP